MTYYSRLNGVELTELNLTTSPAAPTEEQQPPSVDNVVALPKVKRKSAEVYAFDYSGVSDAVAKEAEATAKRIRNRLKVHSLETGKELLNVKKELGHGKFGKWLEFHFGWKERTAQNYMALATAFGATPQVIDALPQSTVYRLAAKSTPDELRQSVIDEVKRGEKPDPKRIEKEIAATKAEARRKRNSDEVAPPNNASILHEASKPDDVQAQAPDAQALMVEEIANEDHNVAADAQLLVDARHEQRAKSIAEHLKKHLGIHFNVIRDAILNTEFAALRAALSET
ncbi:DUF3102 domain-containing protein [Neorhizobium sp. AL 9.2.2]|uniref:DUF3102 domain-containing protein n=1 Tax=Neorhizobium sp. AL 9.2.2 TaxID=2712894 RepID=UPI0015741AA8|nr:DUF3102 domain-containing protein [Neorhizobium sp. AL 9.2.2]NSY16310.1 DUF3102 domain-containing protein [Neorhizobium sp. AL 9.2.2]